MVVQTNKNFKNQYLLPIHLIFYSFFLSLLQKTIRIFFSISLILLGITLLSIVYSYSQIDVSLKDLMSVEIKLASLSISDLISLSLGVLSGDWILSALVVMAEIDLGLVFELSNNGFFSVYVPDLSYDLSINGILLGHGYSKINTTINPGETKKIEVFQNLQKSSLSPAIESLSKMKGIADVRINGTAYFELFGQKIPVSFESNRQVSIIDEIQKKIDQTIQN